MCIRDSIFRFLCRRTPHKIRLIINISATLVLIIFILFDNLYIHVINFKEKILELDGGERSVKINFENVINKVRTTGVKLLPKRVVENNIDTKINLCREGEYLDVDNEMSNINKEVWEIRADEFCSGGEAVSYTHLDVYKRQVYHW